MYPGAVSRCHLTSIGIPMLNTRRSCDCLIINMGIPIPGKDRLYIEMGPWCSVCKLSHCYSFEEQAPIDFIYECLCSNEVEKLDCMTGHQDSKSNDGRWLILKLGAFHCTICLKTMCTKKCAVFYSRYCSLFHAPPPPLGLFCTEELQCIQDSHGISYSWICLNIA